MSLLSEVLVYDPYVSDDTLAALGAKRATLQDLLQKSDIVSLHMPVTRETTKIINRQSLSWMKPNAAVWINRVAGVAYWLLGVAFLWQMFSNWHA